MIRAADRPNARARLRRRGFPIHGYVGPNGTGKSAVMAYDTIPSLAAGRQVISTVRFLDYANPRPCELSWRECPDELGHEAGHLQAHPCYVPFRDYGQLVNARKCDLILDEVTGIASSRESQSMPFQVSNRLVQLRRLDIAMRWTAPAWGRADIIMRECSQGVTLMSASMPQAAPLNEDGSPRLWMRRRLFCARTYDPTSMDEFQSHKADDVKAEVTAYYWGPGSSMFRAYDTLDSVASLGWANESGMCMVCAGKRAIPKCSCERSSPVKAGAASAGNVEGACDDTGAAVGAPLPGSGLDLREALDVLQGSRC